MGMETGAVAHFRKAKQLPESVIVIIPMLKIPNTLNEKTDDLRMRVAAKRKGTVLQRRKQPSQESVMTAVSALKTSTSPPCIWATP